MEILQSKFICKSYDQIKFRTMKYSNSPRKYIHVFWILCKSQSCSCLYICLQPIIEKVSKKATTLLLEALQLELTCKVMFTQSFKHNCFRRNMVTPQGAQVTMFPQKQLCLKFCVNITLHASSNWSASNYKVVILFETFLIIGCKPI